MLARINTKDGKPAYHTPTLNLMSELFKLAYSGMMLRAYYPDETLSFHPLDPTSLKYAVPALLYTCTNNTKLWLAGVFDGASRAILDQLQIPCTALLLWLVLAR